MEDAGRTQDAAGLRKCRVYPGSGGWMVAVSRNGVGVTGLSQADQEATGRRWLRDWIRREFPVVERIICQYGCVICQAWHDEDDGPIFWQHIHRHGKHQGPTDKVLRGQWVWRNEPYWTRSRSVSPPAGLNHHPLHRRLDLPGQRLQVAVHLEPSSADVMRSAVAMRRMVATASGVSVTTMGGMGDPRH